MAKPWCPQATTIIQQIAPANIEILESGLTALLTSPKHYQTKFLCHFHPMIEIEGEVISNLTLNYSLTTMKKLASSAGVFFGSANVFARESAMLKPKHPPLGLLFLLSPIFHCHKIKDGSYNTTNTNKVSLTQNTPRWPAKLKIFVYGLGACIIALKHHWSRPPWIQWHTERASAPQVYQYKITQSTGMATQMQLKVLFGTKSHVRPDF